MLPEIAGIARNRNGIAAESGRSTTEARQAAKAVLRFRSPDLGCSDSARFRCDPVAIPAISSTLP